MRGKSIGQIVARRLTGAMVSDEIEKELVDAGVRAEFGVEGGREEMAFANEDRKVVTGGEGFNVGAGMNDAGSADEDHLEWAAFEFCGLGEDGRVDLAAVGVALDGDIQGGEGFLRGVLYVFGEEDCAGACAEGGRGFDEGLKGVEETTALEEFKEGSGFAAGNDETIEISEFGWSADEFCGHAEAGEGFGMGFECALQGEDADGDRAGGLRG